VTNPFSGIITSDLKALFTNAIDALLEDDACMIKCKLIYGDTKWSNCCNCIFDATKNRSSNKYKSGGPTPFYHGVCPHCKGVGRVATESTEDIYLLPLWNYRDWITWAGSAEKSRYPEGSVQTMSKMNTLAQLSRAKEVIINTDITHYEHHKFTRAGKPTPIGFGNDAYIFTMWEHLK